jgi:hypothetical protein
LRTALRTDRNRLYDPVDADECVPDIDFGA